MVNRKQCDVFNDGSFFEDFFLSFFLVLNYQKGCFMAEQLIYDFLVHVHAKKKYIAATKCKCLKWMISIGQRIQQSRENDLITHKMYIETINTLHSCEVTLSQINEMYFHRALRTLIITQNTLWKVMELCGCDSLAHILEMNNCSEKNSHLHFYTKFFNPISITMCKNLRDADYSEMEIIPSKITTSDICHAESLVLQIHGAELLIQCENARLIVKGYFDTNIVNVHNMYFPKKYLSVRTQMLQVKEVPLHFIEGYIHQFSLGFFCTHTVSEIVDDCVQNYKQIEKIKNMTISSLVKHFLTCSTFEKRETILLLLLNEDDSDTEHLAYLLYDMISNRAYVMASNTCADDIFISFHWSIQDKLKQQLVLTTKKLDSITEDVSDVLSYEKQILLLKTKDEVKAKAMTKLKEVKNGKGADVTKATQYLDGLLKIPFGIYKKEPITHELSFHKTSYDIIMNDVPEQFKSLVQSTKETTYYTIDNFVQKTVPTIRKSLSEAMDEQLAQVSVKDLRTIAKTLDVKTVKMRKSGILKALAPYVHEILLEQFPSCYALHLKKWLDRIDYFAVKWNTYSERKQNYISNVSTILDDAVFGLNDAKDQIKRIIAQWINGENRGYVFGLEGPPGTGKTTLAKQGISNCLQDEEGVKRPFVFIALGGSTNGSTLEGHNYTYVGSTWGKIVDALMTAKCMNPIIYIDELDKISNTEHGREIIGILIHLTDPSQNEEFMDRYFSGIPIDLSQCLIIFSYNDASKVDRILLDRIHRIKTKALDKYEKATIITHYILPEIITTIGFNKEDIILEEPEIFYLINTYTYEAGVRKVKEKLFHILRHINLHILLESDNFKTRPIKITKELIDDILQNHYKHRIKSIPNKDHVGIANGLYATKAGVGGLTMIQIFPVYAEKNFSLKITGQQGDVMKESISVAQTVAWHLLSLEQQKVLEGKENWGLHLHCPEGATPKDGPSAGGVLTVSFLSMFTNQPINRFCAMTGEIDLLGNIMPIGGLPSKLEGARIAGAKVVLIPRDNEDDYEKIKRETPQFKEDDTFRIVVVDTIQDVIPYMFTDMDTLNALLKHPI